MDQQQQQSPQQQPHRSKYQIKNNLNLQNLNPKNIKIKKDKVFILVMIIVVANLAYNLMSTLYGIFTNYTPFGSPEKYNTFYLVLLAIIDTFGIIGVLWLLRSYRRTLRALKKQQEQKANEGKTSETK
jgi:hypothetical protein